MNLSRKWYRTLYTAIARYAFNRIELPERPAILDQMPTLYLCLHRNGALDGAVYQRFAPEAQLTPASQLRRNFLARIIFGGIEIVRAKDAAKDGARANNADSFKKCAEHLAQGGSLIFFPEGTSDLGARHLPFKRGMASLIEETLARTPKLAVVALSAHYEDGPAWQSNVEVVATEPLILEGPNQPGLMARLKTLMESVSLDCDSLDERQDVETLAYAATLGQRNVFYARELARVSQSPQLPQQRQALRELQARAAQEGLATHQGVPLIPTQHQGLYAAFWMILAPIVAGAALLNLPVLLAQRAAVKKLADAPNVASLWRALAGVGASAVWAPIMILALGFGLGVWAAVAYAGWSLVGLKSLYRFKKLSIALNNAKRATPATRERLLALHRELTKESHASLNGLGHGRVDPASGGPGAPLPALDFKASRAGSPD